MADWMASVAVTVLGTLGTVLATGWLFRQTDRVPEAAADGTFLLRYPAAYAWLGWIATGMFGGLALTSLLHPEGAPALALGFVPFVAGGVALVLSHRTTYAAVSPGGLVLHAWTRREPLAVRWAEVERVSFSRWGYLVLHTRDGRKARLSGYLVGASRLAALVGENLDVPGATTAVQSFRSFREAYGG